MRVYPVSPLEANLQAWYRCVHTNLEQKPGVEDCVIWLCDLVAEGWSDSWKAAHGSAEIDIVVARDGNVDELVKTCQKRVVLF
jgi:hypothetical protein